MSKKAVFEGAAVALITPFNDDLSINYDEFGKIIEDQIINGTDALVICGTTGEASTMTDEEHIECIRYSVECAKGRVPVIAGTGSNDTDYAIWLSKEAEKAGADALLVVTPYYNKCTQKGLIAHFTAIADSVNIPIILYHIPGRTGVTMQPQTIYELSKHPRIVGVKDASANFSSIAKIAELCGEDFAIYSGNDDQIVPILSLGGKGVISVLSNVAPSQTHQIVRSYLDGDTKTARNLQLKYLSLIDALFCEVNPIPVKAAMEILGCKTKTLRLPLTEAEESTKARLTEEMKKVGLL